MKKWNWYLPCLSKEQAEKLKEAMLIHYRMHLRMAIPTIGWMPRKKVLWVKLSVSSPSYESTKRDMGEYVSGFYAAIKTY